MVKLKKNKLKQLSKLAKKQTTSPTNKVLKKKHNVEKKVTFQKEILLKETVKSGSLVQRVLSKSDILSKVPKEKSKTGESNKVKKSKKKSVESKKKRQKTQICDTKLILSLMKKKFNEQEEMANIQKK